MLDYVIMNKDDLDLVEEMTIDEERSITPWYRCEEEHRDIYTDHNTIKLKINWNMRYKKGERSRISYNDKTKAIFKEKTTKGKLKDIWEQKESGKDIQTMYTEWNDEVKKIAEESFTTKKIKRKVSREVRLLTKKKKKLKEQAKNATKEEFLVLKTRTKLIDRHLEKFSKETKKRKAIKTAKEIKKDKGIDGIAFWEYDKRMKGKKSEAAHAMKNEDGVVEEDPTKILEIYRTFYQKLLTQREMVTEDGKKIEAGVNKFMEVLEKTARRMKIAPVTKEEYETVKKGLKMKKAADSQGWKYEMITSAGDDLEESILMMLNKVVCNYVVPTQWEEVLIKSIYKGKGDRKSMDFKRGLFLTNIVSKVAEKVIKNRNKETIDGSLTPFQCGGVRHRGIQDNKFVFNTIIEEFRKKKINLHILFADLEKCFDKLWLKDSIKELAKTGMPLSEVLYVYLMNRFVQAYVLTPIGRTEVFEAHEIVKQGTVMAVDLCAVSTDRINMLEGEGDVIQLINGVQVKNPVFVDDQLMCGTKSQIEKSEAKLGFLEETKKYTYNNKKGKSEILSMKFGDKEEEKPTIKVGKGEIESTEDYKYLGDKYDEEGSNMGKINKKMEKSNYMVSEVKRTGSYEEVGDADTEVRMLLLQSVVKPTLLHSTETWINIKLREWTKLSSDHNNILRRTFEQKQNTPYWGIIAETGIWPYKYEVIYKRLMFYHDLVHSDEKRIARRILLNQMENIEKHTWYAGVEMCIREIGLETTREEVEESSKYVWKTKVKNQITLKIQSEVENKKGAMTKLRFVDKFEKKDYICRCNMAVVKRIMTMRLNMVEVKRNFRAKYNNMMCPACGDEEETTEHVILCHEYKRIVGHNIDRIDMNDLQWQIEASRVYKNIEETRRWLVEEKL